MVLGFVCPLTGIRPVAESVMSGDAMDNLIQQPGGSGEANMVRMALTVTAAVYLDKTKQWDAIGLEKRNQALEHIEAGG